MSSLSGSTLCVVEDVTHHPNADRLDIVHVDGCPAIVGRGEFTQGEEVVFVPFDMMVPADATDFPEFTRGKRVRAVKLRGIFSMGITLKNKWNFRPGDNIDDVLGLVKWEPVITDGEAISGPRLICPKYDLESLRKYHSLLVDGESVVITEKIHGTNARFVYCDGQLYVGSRTRWLEESSNVWWRAARKYDLTTQLSGDMEGLVLYGEVFGQVQDLKYGTSSNDVKLAVFDVYDPQQSSFWSWNRVKFLKLPTPLPPILYEGPWKGLDYHQGLAEGKSYLANHVREGFVVKPSHERYDAEVGRVAFKLHGEGYLCR